MEGQKPVQDLFEEAEGVSQPAQPMEPLMSQPQAPETVAPTPAPTMTEMMPQSAEETGGRGGRMFGRGSRVRLIIVIILSVVLLAGGAILALMQQQQSDTAATNQTPTVNTTAGAVNTTTNNTNTSTGTVDTDGDGLIDSEEQTLGTLTTDIDTDNDQLTDRQEVKIYKTNPLSADTDKDGFSDGEEVRNFYNPNGSGKMLDIVNAIDEFESQ